MSLVAVVYCRCVMDDLASPPPFDHNFLKCLENGRLEIQLPSNVDVSSLKLQKYQWEKDCCVHPWRQAVNEWICDWRGIKLFRTALKTLGAQRFPTLISKIPSINAGEVSWAESAKALHELDLFEQSLNDGQYSLISLLDTQNDKELCAHGETEKHCIYMTENQEFKLGAQGLEVQDQESEQVVFESSHFKQRLICQGKDGKFIEVAKQNKGEFQSQFTVFQDLVTNKVWHAQGDLRVRNVDFLDTDPKELKVIKRLAKVDDFTYILQPLKKVFSASVKMVHPVLWG